jgi:hypothetical protein
VASTPGLADVLRHESHAVVRTITDPVEGLRADARVRDVAVDPVSAARPIQVTIVSAGPAMEELAHAADSHYMNWSPAALFGDLKKCEAIQPKPSRASDADHKASPFGLLLKRLLVTGAPRYWQL